MHPSTETHSVHPATQRAGGWRLALVLACLPHLVGCGHEPPPEVEFQDETLLLGLGGRYKLDLLHEGAVSSYDLSVQGRAVGAQLAVEDGAIGSRVVVWVEALEVGESVVQLHRGDDVVDVLPVEVAPVAAVRFELLYDLSLVLLEEPFALLVGEGVLLRLAGVDARGRAFDRHYREIVDVGEGIEVTQAYRNIYSAQTRWDAGEFAVTVEVDQGRELSTSLHVLDPSAIVAIHIEPWRTNTVRTLGTDTSGRRVHLVDASVRGEGVRFSDYGVSYLEDNAEEGTVLTATWSGLSATYVLPSRELR